MYAHVGRSRGSSVALSVIRHQSFELLCFLLLKTYPGELGQDFTENIGMLENNLEGVSWGASKEGYREEMQGKKNWKGKFSITNLMAIFILIAVPAHKVICFERSSCQMITITTLTLSHLSVYLWSQKLYKVDCISPEILKLYWELLNAFPRQEGSSNCNIH